jgi:hypothetical protein
VLFVLSFVPALATAKKVAVVPAAFVYSDTGQESLEASKKLTDFAVKGVKDAQCELVEQDAVGRAIEAVTSPASGSGQPGAAGAEQGQCRDEACLARLAEHLGVDDVVFVRVTEFAELDREIGILLAGGAPPVKKRSGDGFMVLLQEVRRLVALKLQQSLTEERHKEAAPTPSVTRTPASGQDPILSPPQVALSAPSAREARQLGPLPFSIIAGVAVASGIVWGVLDGLVYRRYQRMKSGETSLDYWEKTRDLQVAEWTMVGLTGISTIAAVTLFFLTDFRTSSNKEAASRRSVRFSPSPMGGGGMMVFEGRF